MRRAALVVAAGLVLPLVATGCGKKDAVGPDGEAGEPAEAAPPVTGEGRAASPGTGSPSGRSTSRYTNRYYESRVLLAPREGRTGAGSLVAGIMTGSGRTEMVTNMPNDPAVPR